MNQLNISFLSHRRLDRSDAVQQITHLFNLGVEEAADLAAAEHPKSYPPPIARTVQSPDSLLVLRDMVVALAREHGYPVRKGKSSSLSRFDSALGNLLVAELRMTPAEAGVEEVWNFLSLVLLPDIAVWRYRNESLDPEYPRWLGKPRNVLRKAWWRSYVIGSELNLELGEDEGVAIMERPTFGMNPELARLVASAHIETSSKVNYPKSELLRRLMVQLGKIASFVDIDCLDVSSKKALIEESYDHVIKNLPLTES